MYNIVLSDFFDNSDTKMANLIKYYIINNGGINFEQNWPKEIKIPEENEWNNICSIFNFNPKTCKEDYYYIMNKLGYKINGNKFINSSDIRLTVCFNNLNNQILYN